MAAKWSPIPTRGIGHRSRSRSLNIAEQLKIALKGMRTTQVRVNNWLFVGLA